MWALVTQFPGRVAASDPDGFSAHGSLVARTVEACAGVLRSVVLVTIAADAATKEDAQAALEALYKTHAVSRLVEACKQYGSSLSPRCVAVTVNALHELVLSSSKFLAQVLAACTAPFGTCGCSDDGLLYFSCSLWTRMDWWRWTTCLWASSGRATG